MPLYNYKCPYCNHKQEEFRLTFHGRDKAECENCGGTMSRSYDDEGFNARPDIEPGYNTSLGAYVTSRADMRDYMAFHNAASNDMIINSYPSDGRLVKEERKELMQKGDIFDNRKKPGWGRTSPDSGFDIETEGVADYQEIRDYAKDYKKKKGVM